MSFGSNTLRLLAVDDDVASAELIVRIAERCRFEAFATSDSRGVMNLASALDPDIIAVDICMPNLDANDLLVLLAKAKYRGRVLIVSGQDPEVLNETKMRAIELGHDRPEVMQKPIDMVALRNLLQECSMSAAA